MTSDIVSQLNPGEMVRTRSALSKARRQASSHLRVGALRALSLAPYDLRRTIVVSGSPRSGTTWLAQAIGELDGSSILFEPLQLELVPEARRAGLSWRTYVEPGTNWPDAERFLRRVLQGKVLNDWTTRRIQRIRRTDTWIVKFVRANRMLAWITERFPIRSPVLLVRHPCAVIASQLRHGWDEVGGPTSKHVSRVRPELVDLVERLETQCEVLAAMWALDHVVPLETPQPPWQLVCYERLVRDPEPHFRAIFGRWSLDVPDGLWERLAIPSLTADPTVGPRSQDELVAGWRHQLEPDQVRRILRVVRAFGIDLYDDSPDPDESSLVRYAAG